VAQAEESDEALKVEVESAPEPAEATTAISVSLAANELIDAGADVRRMLRDPVARRAYVRAVEVEGTMTPAAFLAHSTQEEHRNAVAEGPEAPDRTEQPERSAIPETPAEPGAEAPATPGAPATTPASEAAAPDGPRNPWLSWEMHQVKCDTTHTAVGFEKGHTFVLSSEFEWNTTDAERGGTTRIDGKVDPETAGRENIKEEIKKEEQPDNSDDTVDPGSVPLSFGPPELDEPGKIHSILCDLMKVPKRCTNVEQRQMMLKQMNKVGARTWMQTPGEWTKSSIGIRSGM
jgi:hypothetical protein